MKNKFKDMQNYTVIMKLCPEVYGFVNITALVGKNHSKTSYRINRTLQYRSSFYPLRDRMLAGLVTMYDKIFELLKGKQINNGTLKNYYAIAIETGNDIPRRILKFDMYIIQADSYKELVAMPDFQDLIKSATENDKTKNVAIYAFGYQYEHDMESIDITNKVMHMKAYKDTHTSVIKSWNFEEDSDLEVDMDSENFIQFINKAFEGTDRYVYNIGLTIDDHTWPHNLEKGEPVKLPENAPQSEPVVVEHTETAEVIEGEPKHDPAEQIVNLSDMGMSFKTEYTED